MSDVKEIGPLRWDQVLSELERLSESTWLFRGQGDARWDLKTTLERHAPKDKSRVDSERKLIHEFQRRAHAYLQPHQIPVTAGGWLALMEHFGAPTRLLDVTRSPYVAAYFAVEDAAEGVDACAVWAFDQLWCYKQAGGIVAARNPKATESAAAFLDEAKTKLSTEIFIGLGQTWEIAAEADSWLTALSDPMVLPFSPERIDERLSAQQGEFLIPRDVSVSFMENLRSLQNLEEGVVKVNLRMSERGRALTHLRRLNITRASLFPGLDGFAQSFRQLLIEEDEEAKLNRLKREALLNALRG